MAFPSVTTADTQTGSVTTNATTFPLTYPTNLQNGDLILAFISSDGNQTTPGTWPAGWVTNNWNGGQTTNSLVIAKKVSNGAETGTFNVTGLSSEQGPWRVIRIPAAQWEGTLGTSFGNSASTDGSVTATNGGSASTNANPDPPSNDPFNWAAEDTLWIAIAGNDGTPTYSGFPANYTQEDHSTSGGHSQSSGGAGGAGMGIAYRKLNASSENPGTFTLTGSEQWATFTIAVRPAAPAAPPTPYNPAVNMQGWLAQ